MLVFLFTAWCDHNRISHCSLDIKIFVIRHQLPLPGGEFGTLGAHEFDNVIFEKFGKQKHRKLLFWRKYSEIVNILAHFAQRLLVINPTWMENDIIWCTCFLESFIFTQIIVVRYFWMNLRQGYEIICRDSTLCLVSCPSTCQFSCMSFLFYTRSHGNVSP